MDVTENLALPIPDDDDTGATALYLEALARAADDKLGAYQDELNGFLKPYYSVCQATGDTISPGVEYAALPDLWSNSGGTVIDSNFPVAGSFTGSFPRPGWWAIGALRLGSSPASGTVNNQGMNWILEAFSYDIVPGQTTTLMRETRVYLDSNTSGEFAEVHGTVYVPPGVTAWAGLKLFHQHAVDRVISSGSVGYRYYIGSGDAAQRMGL